MIQVEIYDTGAGWFWRAVTVTGQLLCSPPSPFESADAAAGHFDTLMEGIRGDVDVLRLNANGTSTIVASYEAEGAHR